MRFHFTNVEVQEMNLLATKTVGQCEAPLASARTIAIFSFQD